MTISEFFDKVYPLLLDKTLEKVEKKLATGETIKAYWVVNIIRIDIRIS